MFMSEIELGSISHKKKQTTKMTDLISYIYALIDLENKLHNTKKNITSNDF